jgi:hypothetical protein
VTGKLDSHLESVFEGLAHLETGQEGTDEGITTSVGILPLLLLDVGDLDGQNLGLDTFSFTDADDERLGSLGDDGDTSTLGVSLLVGAHVFASSESILSLESLLLGEGAGFIFIAESVVGVLNGVHDFIEVGVEEEGSGDVESHRLVVGGAVATDLLHGISVGSDEESSGVNEVGGLEVGLIKEYKWEC